MQLNVVGEEPSQTRRWIGEFEMGPSSRQFIMTSNIQEIDLIFSFSVGFFFFFWCLMYVDISGSVDAYR